VRADILPVEIPDLLANLVERSLVVCDPATGRHHMLESMRVYTAEHLSEDDQIARRRHFSYFLSYGERMLELNRLFEDAKAHAMFIQEIDNLRLAAEWSLSNDPEGCLHLIVCTGLSWVREHRLEARDLLESAMAAAPDIADADHISARIQLARTKLRQGFFEEAEELFAIARQQIKELPDTIPILRFYVILGSGVQQLYVGNHKVAREYFLEALELATKNGMTALQGAANVNLGELCRANGDLSGATKYYEEALRLSHRDPFSDSLVLFNIGSVAIQLNDLERALDYFRQSIDALHGATGLETANGPIAGLGYICIKRGRYREAGLLMGYPEGRRKRNKSRMDPIDEALFEEYRALGLSLGGEVFATAFEEGATLTKEELARLVEQATRVD